jgi:hypothetical protein
MRVSIERAEHRADVLIWNVARAVFVLNLLALIVLWLLPMPERAAVPGRAPRVVVGS